MKGWIQIYVCTCVLDEVNSLSRVFIPLLKHKSIHDKIDLMNHNKLRQIPSMHIRKDIIVNVIHSSDFVHV